MKSQQQNMSDQSIETKQQYLREKILQTGHDAEAFMAYCQQRQGEIDLQGWTLGKLKSIVKEFLGQHAEKTFTQEQLDNEEVVAKDYQQQVIPHSHVVHTQPKVQQKKQFVFTEADWQIFGLGQAPKKQTATTPIYPIYPNSNIVSMSPPSGISVKGINNEPVAQSNIKFQELFKFTSTQPEKLPTQNLSMQKQSPQNIKILTQTVQKKSSVKQVQQIRAEFVPNNNQITQIGNFSVNVVASRQLAAMPVINDIKVIKTEQKSRNFLQGDYTLYHIQFYPSNFIIEKKFNDFRKLRTILQKIYPHIRLPYLQPEGWLVNSSESKDPQTVIRYKHMIIEFMKFISIRNQFLKKSKIVRVFIGLQEGGDNQFKKYQNIAKPKQFFQMCLPNGKLNFAKYQNLAPIDRYLTNTQTLTMNIDAQYQKLRKSLQILFHNYEHLGKSLIQVATIFQTLQQSIQKFNFQNCSNKDLRVYEGIKQICLKIKERMDGQYDIFRNKIQTLFKYQRQNMGSLKQLNQVRTKMYYEYCRQGLNTKKTTEIISKGDTTSENNISIEQPSKSNKINLTIQNMFWNHYAYKGTQQYWTDLRYKINQQLTLIAYDELDSENSNLNFWNSVIKRCVM